VLHSEAIECGAHFHESADCAKALNLAFIEHWGSGDYGISAEMQGADKNYAPPKAPIADLRSANDGRMPPAVLGAVIFLWMLTGLMALGSVVLFIQHRLTAPSSTLSMAMALLAYCIGKRSRTARIVFAVFSAIMLTAIFVLLTGSMTHWPKPLAGLGLALVWIICWCLLFTPRANAWFKNRS
jgi:hypothetical protein